MTDDLNLRLETVEGTLSTVVVLIEGEPVLDIDGTKIGTEGGMVQQGERNAEALHIIDHKLDGLLSRRWTLTQRISASGVAVVFLGIMVPVVRAF